MSATAADLFKAGKLDEAIAAQVAEVKAQPLDGARRAFLLELKLFAGDLDGAGRQLEAMKAEGTELERAATSYRQAIAAERARRSFFFEGGPPPEILGDPAGHLARRLEAVVHSHAGRFSEATRAILDANEATPEAPGLFNGEPFASLRDADELFAGVLEVFAQGRYVWVPLETVESVAMNPPAFPRDLIFAPARVSVAGKSSEVFLPVLYPGTHNQADDAVRLGRLTEWVPAGVDDDAPILGVGARYYLLDEDREFGLLEWRELVRPAAGPVDEA